MLDHPHTSAVRVPTDVAYRGMRIVIRLHREESGRASYGEIASGYQPSKLYSPRCTEPRVITQSLDRARPPPRHQRAGVLVLAAVSERILVALTLTGGAVRTLSSRQKAKLPAGAREVTAC